MPTENEAKFILDVKTSEKKFAKICQSAYLIRQGYIGPSSLRIREKIPIIGHGKTIREFCYKRRINNRTLEIELPVDERDFKDLWSLTDKRLIKVRYNIYCRKRHKRCLWEVDFFKNKKSNIYFVMAEHEMPEKQKRPKFIPEAIEENLVFKVPLDDQRFTSRRLSSSSYGKLCYLKLMEKLHQ